VRISEGLDCAAAAERVEDKVTPFGAIQDCGGDEANWLHRWVHLQLVHSLPAKRIDPGIDLIAVELQLSFIG
jgi:hypothetical protein